MHFDRSQKPYINPIRTNYSAFWNYWLTLLHIFSAIGSSFRKKSKKKKITQGSSFCKKSRKEKITQGSKFGEPRKEIVPQGSKFGEPRKEIVPQGLSIRKKPREEIISPVNIFTHFLEGCQSHEEPEKEIITQSNGFKPGEEMKKEVTGEGSMFGEPRKEIVPQGLSIRKKAREEIISPGCQSREETEKEIITQSNGFKPGEEITMEVTGQGSKFGEPRKKIVPQGLSIRKKAREEIISPGSKFGEPRKEIVPQGSKFGVPRKEIAPQGCQSHEETEKEIITQSNGFKTGEEIKMEVTGQGSKFGVPRKEIAPQGLSIRKKAREEIISPGCQSHEEPEKEIITQSNGFKPGEEIKMEVTGQGFPIPQPQREEIDSNRSQEIAFNEEAGEEIFPLANGFPLPQPPRVKINSNIRPEIELNEEAGEEIFPLANVCPVPQPPRVEINGNQGAGYPNRQPPREEFNANQPQVPDKIRYKVKVNRTVEVYPRHKKYKLSYVLEPIGVAGEIKIQDIDLLSYMLGLTSRRIAPFTKCFPMA